LHLMSYRFPASILFAECVVKPIPPLFFKKYIFEMIKDRKASNNEARYDLFSSLLDANNEDNVDMRLTETELIGKFSGVLTSLRQLISL
jgi:hypothetical protein